MKHGKITNNYAKAIFGLAKEKNKIDPVKKDIDLINSIWHESYDFRRFFVNPVVNKPQKLDIVNSIFKGKINEFSLNFILLIVENNREAELPGVCRRFRELYLEEKGIRKVDITSAVALNKNLIEQIKNFLENELKSNVELSEKVDPRLIGGFILTIDDKQVDASVATQLKKIKDKLLE